MADYLEQGLLNHVFGGPAFAQPTALYMALEAVADPVGAPTVSVEVAGNGYARVQVYDIGSASTPRFTAPAAEAGGGNEVTNEQDVDFGRAAGGDWGSIGYFSLWDAPAGGNLLVRRAFEAVKVIEDGDRYVILAGDAHFPLRQLPE